MGIISSLSRRMRASHTFSCLSTTQLTDEDSKDLIKPAIIASPVHEQDENTESTSPTSTTSSTLVHQSPTEAIQPSESPQERKPFSPTDLNFRTLLENTHSPNVAKDQTVSPLRVPEYPVLKLDTTISPSDTPSKTLDAPLDPEQKMIGRSKTTKWKWTDSWDGGEIKDGPGRKEERSRLRRSMTGALRRGFSLKISRTPSSSSGKSLKNKSSLSWLDSSSLMGDKCGVDDNERRWLEAHGIKGGRDIGRWSGDGMEQGW